MARRAKLGAFKESEKLLLCGKRSDVSWVHLKTAYALRGYFLIPKHKADDAALLTQDKEGHDGGRKTTRKDERFLK